MTRSRFPALVAAIAAAGALIGLAAYRFGARPDPATSKANRDRLINSSQRVLATIAMSPLADAPDPAAIRAVLARAELAGPIAPERLGALLDEAADFLWRRFVENDPKSYSRWRMAKGDLRESRQDMLAYGDVADDYRFLGGGELPRDADLAGVFEFLFVRGLAAPDGASRPVALASEPRGLIVQPKVLTPEESGWETPRGTLGIEHWRGPVVATARRWWRPVRTEQDLLTRDGRAESATVGVIMELADGARRPFLIFYVWDPNDDRWRLCALAMTNYFPEKMTILEY
ncbi:MAG: hypothetical protein JNM07_12345 [Phycisphaerae bacterium]|nr:hypothetical protein [Phycisphaerae bacterium]